MCGECGSNSKATLAAVPVVVVRRVDDAYGRFGSMGLILNPGSPQPERPQNRPPLPDLDPSSGAFHWRSARTMCCVPSRVQPCCVARHRPTLRSRF